MQARHGLVKKLGGKDCDGGRINAAAQFGADGIVGIQPTLDGAFQLLAVGIHIFAGILQLQRRFGVIHHSRDDS